MNHIAHEVVTSKAFDVAAQHVLEKGINKSLNGLMDEVIYPNKWGVCTKYFWAAFDDNVRYVYGGPEIYDGKIVQGDKLHISEADNGYDTVEALNELAKAKGKDKEKMAAAEAALVAGGALLVGASLPFTALAGGAYYLWKTKGQKRKN